MGEELSYREKDVDAKLEEHDRRISRLEKAGLVALGWGISESAELSNMLLSFLL